LHARVAAQPSERGRVPARVEVTADEGAELLEGLGEVGLEVGGEARLLARLRRVTAKLEDGERAEVIDHRRIMPERAASIGALDAHFRVTPFVATHVQLDRVAADFAVLDELAAQVFLDVQLEDLAAVRALHL